MPNRSKEVSSCLVSIQAAFPRGEEGVIIPDVVRVNLVVDVYTWAGGDDWWEIRRAISWGSRMYENACKESIKKTKRRVERERE